MKPEVVIGYHKIQSKGKNQNIIEIDQKVLFLDNWTKFQYKRYYYFKASINDRGFFLVKI